MSKEILQVTAAERINLQGGLFALCCVLAEKPPMPPELLAQIEQVVPALGKWPEGSSQVVLELYNYLGRVDIDERLVPGHKAKPTDPVRIPLSPAERAVLPVGLRVLVAVVAAKPSMREEFWDFIDVMFEPAPEWLKDETTWPIPTMQDLEALATRLSTQG